MKSESILPIMFIALSFIILAETFHIMPSMSINPMYFLYAVPIIVVVITASKFKNRIKRVIVKSAIEQNLYTFQLEDGEYYFIGFKVVGKEIRTNDMVNYTIELKNAIDAIQRNKTRYLNVAIVTLLDPLPGSAILFYAKKDKVNKDYLLNEAMILKSSIESVASHISLEPVSLKSNLILPFPAVVGSVIFSGYVSQKKFDINADGVTFGDYDIELGVTRGKYEVPVGIKSEDVFKHVSIFGSTGSGKSNTAKLLAKELLKRGFDVIILDWHGEYHEVLPELNYYGQGNFIVVNPIATDEDMIDVAEMMGDALELTEPQKFMLYNALLTVARGGKFDTKSLQDAIESLPDTSAMEKSIKIALTRKVIFFFTGQGSKLMSENGVNYKKLAEMLRGGNIIDLSFIKNLNLRKLYALLILKFILEYYMQSRNRERKVFIILEEAQNYLRKKKDDNSDSGGNMMIERALQEARKFNVGLCIVTQSPSTIDPEVIKNTNIKIVHAIKANMDKDIIAKSMSLTEEEIEYLDKLDTGEAIVVAPNLKREVIVKINKVS